MFIPFGRLLRCFWSQSMYEAPGREGARGGQPTRKSEGKGGRERGWEGGREGEKETREGREGRTEKHNMNRYEHTVP